MPTGDAEIIIPIPGDVAGSQSQSGTSSPQPGSTPKDDIMPMEDSTKLAFEQGFQRAHQTGLNQMERENQAMGFIAEVVKESFISTTREQVGLASGILAQRSAESQPQQASGVATTTGVSGK